MPAAVSGTGRGRGGSPPPPGLSADPSRRPRAGRWLPNPPGLFVGARGRGCLASGVPHALGDAVMPAAPGRARSGLVVSNVRHSRPVVSAPNHHPAEQASSAATAKPPISRAIRQGGKGRRIRTAKSPAIGESLADESWPADPFRNRPLAAWARPVYNTYRLSQNGRLRFSLVSAGQRIKSQISVRRDLRERRSELPLLAAYRSIPFHRNARFVELDVYNLSRAWGLTIVFDADLGNSINFLLYPFMEAFPFGIVRGPIHFCRIG